MMSALDRSVQELGDGTVILLDSGETVFKLDSHENNPIVKPQDIGLTWHENGGLKIGAVFNGGAEVFQDNVILAPRCHQGYQKSTSFDETDNPSYIKKIKEVRGHRWNPEQKCWVFPHSDDVVRKLLSLFKDENIWIDPSLRQIVGQTFRFAEKVPFEGLQREMVSRK